MHCGLSLNGVTRHITINLGNVTTLAGQAAVIRGDILRLVHEMLRPPNPSPTLVVENHEPLENLP